MIAAVLTVTKVVFDGGGSRNLGIVASIYEYVLGGHKLTVMVLFKCRTEFDSRSKQC